MRINGIQCDWCNKAGELAGNSSLPIQKVGEGPWSRVIHQSLERDDELCPDCTQAAHLAIEKAKKYRGGGRRQR
jgi:hypothetical protein